MRHLVFAVALGSIRHVRTQNALVDSDRSASDLMQRTQRNVPCSLWSDTLYFFFVLVAKIREMTRPSLTIPSLTRLMTLRRTRTAQVQWQHACVQPLVRWRVVGVQDHKANTSLTELNLCSNEVGDVGATALSETLKATVLRCTQCVFRACACCYQRCHFTWRCEQLASSGRICSLCCCFCDFLVSSLCYFCFCHSCFLCSS